MASDCRNGGTCNGSNACLCSTRFNGTHCEYQVFRALGVLAGDVSCGVTNISHDGSVVVGGCSPNNEATEHAYRSVKGGSITYIPQPPVQSGTLGCDPRAVDAAGNVLLFCETMVFLYGPSGTATPVPVPSDFRYVGDITPDGAVIVGGGSTQAYRRATL